MKHSVIINRYLQLSNVEGCVRFILKVIHFSFYFMFTLVGTHLILFKGFAQYEIDCIHIKETNEKVVRLGRTFFGLSNLFYIL